MYSIGYTTVFVFYVYIYDSWLQERTMSKKECLNEKVVQFWVLHIHVIAMLARSGSSSKENLVTSSEFLAADSAVKR